MERRQFLSFLGWGTAGVMIAPQLSFGQMHGGHIHPILPSAKDQLITHPSLRYSILASWEDTLSNDLKFGYNNDFLQFIPIDKTRAKLWVNHEYIDPFFVSKAQSFEKTKAQVIAEMQQVGGSIWDLTLVKGEWKIDLEGQGYQLHANIPIPFSRNETIKGSSEAIGTLANCSGGLTPWGTILTCEENYDQFWGEIQDPEQEATDGYMGWQNHFNRPSEHYGWVVEFNPTTKAAKKHIGLGRCAHECAHVVQQEDQTVVVYTGDDANFQCLYKYIANTPGSLEHGDLYVANVEKGLWIPLNWDQQPALKSYFKDQTQVLTYLRKAAELVGGSKLDRPEDIERDPNTGDILVALTNNSQNNNPFGSIMRIRELDGYQGKRFQADHLLTGGPETGFACPDNMAFDPHGNLWFTSDISGYKTNKPPYAEFGNNGLFLVPNSGEQAGEVLQIMSAPINAELTGPCFTPDGQHLFLSVQHPGEGSKDHDRYISNWPHGGKHKPRPSVVVVSGFEEFWKG